MAELAEAGTIRVGTKFDQPGFGLENLEGEVEGFDVEVAKIIAGALGIAPEDIEWVETPSAVREEVLEGDEVDMVVATYTINDERKERITFAGPYYQAGQQIMVAADDDTITGPESLTENPDAKVCSRDRLDAVGEHPRVPRQRRPAGALRGVLAVRRRARERPGRRR